MTAPVGRERKPAEPWGPLPDLAPAPVAPAPWRPPSIGPAGDDQRVSVARQSSALRALRGKLHELALTYLQRDKLRDELWALEELAAEGLEILTDDVEVSLPEEDPAGYLAASILDELDARPRDSRERREVWLADRLLAIRRGAFGTLEAE